MHTSHSGVRRALACVAAVLATVTAVVLPAGGAAEAAPPTSVKAACNSLSDAQLASPIPYARCFAEGRPDPTSGKMKARTLASGPLSTSLGPAEIQDAYKLPDGGAGQTVAIVDAFGYDSAESDLSVWRSYYGLPACTTANGCFTKLDQRGGTAYPEQDAGWSLETALDLDAVSAACPKCKILLVQADSASFLDLAESVDTAAARNPVSISNSYGVDGEIPTASLYDAYYDHPGIAVTVSSGDTGNVQSWPSTNPDVVSVGGTSLTRDTTSSRGWKETAWDSAGSGCSLYEAKPDFQAAVTTNCANRASADIAADADSATGLAVYNTLYQDGWDQWGGTSLASPLVAAMYALAGTPTPGTYPVTYPYLKSGELYDVTSGSNGGCGTLLCNAGPGYDGPTGLGTPVGLGGLTLGDNGEVKGKVTDKATGTGLSGATVAATDADGHKYLAGTDASGVYDLHAPVGTYDLAVTLYGYGAGAATGVPVAKGQAVTEDFALTAKASKTVSGHVTDGSGHGWPMRAKITIDGYPDGAIYSDPTTGAYSVNLPTGSTYKMHFAAADLPGYLDQDETVAVNGKNVTANAEIPVDTVSCTAPGYAFQQDGLTESFTGWTGATARNGWTITDAAGQGQTWRFDNPGGWQPPLAGDNDFADIDSNAFGDGGVQDSSLVSPVIDLSGQDDPEIGFDDSYIWFPDQTGSVDLSLDGGTTWSSVLTMNGGAAARYDIRIPQAAGHDDVRVRFHYTGSWSRRWEVDNVIVGGRYCGPSSAGIVAGFIGDANTGAPLADATVTSDAYPAEFGTTDADGYYWFVSSHPGTTSALTVTDGLYAAGHTKVKVKPDAVQEADLDLQAGHLTVADPAVSTSLTLGASKTTSVTFGNDGQAPLNVHLGEGFGTTTPMAAGPARVNVAAAVSDTEPTATGGGTAPARQANPAAAPWTDIADYAIEVMDPAVAYHGGTVWVVGGFDGLFKLAVGGYYDAAAGGWRRIADLPEALDGASAGFVGDTLYVAGGWNSSGAASTHAYAYDQAANSWTRIADLPAATAMAGSAVVDGKFWIVSGCGNGSCAPVSASVSSYDPAAAAWTKQADYPAAGGFLSCGGIRTTVVCAGGTSGGVRSAATYALTSGTSSWVAEAPLPNPTWAAAGTSANGRFELLGGVVDNKITNANYAYDLTANAWLPMPNSNNAVYRGGAACGIFKVGGATGGFTATKFAESLPQYSDCGEDVPWMSENRTDFTIAAGKTVTVKVTTDSAALTQPGTYTAALKISTDSPYLTDTPVTVTMTANPPASWGKIDGVVSSSAGTPIAGATVAICTMYDTATGACGPTTYTLKTDASGHYSLWLNKGYNPLQVIAAKDGYTPIMKIVKIQKGETVTTGFTLQASSAFTSSAVSAYLKSTMHSK